MYYSGMPKGVLVEAAEGQAFDIDSAEDDIKQTSPQSYLVDASELYHIAKYMRFELRKVKNQMPKVPSSSDLMTDQVSIPSVVYNLLHWVIAEEAGDDDVIHERISSKSDV